MNFPAFYICRLQCDFKSKITKLHTCLIDKSSLEDKFFFNTHTVNYERIPL